MKALSTILNLARAAVLLLAVGACVIAYLVFVPQRARVRDAATCLYRYQYIDDADEIQNDAVQLSDADAARVLRIVNRQDFRFYLDYVTGVSEDHTLEFTDARGRVRRIYLVYGSGYALRIGEWNLQCVLSDEDKKELYDILGTYDRFEHVLIAG